MTARDNALVLCVFQSGAHNENHSWNRDGYDNYAFAGDSVYKGYDYGSVGSEIEYD
jgi:hypothetical protein